MRMPCTVSCRVSNSARAAGELRCGDRVDAADQLAQHQMAGGAMTKPKSDITGSCITITVTRPISDSKSRPTEVISRFSTCVAAAAPVDSRARNSDRMPVGEEAEAFLQQLVEQRRAGCRR